LGFKLIEIYKTFFTCILMQLKDFLSKVSENRSNGQLVTCLKKNELKKSGMTQDELFNLNIDFKLKKLLTSE